MPTPAMAGALALIVAGIGSVAISSHTDRDALSSAKYQTISSSYTGADTGSSSVDVSRGFDRALINKQAAAQAKQQQAAVAQLTSKAQKVAKSNKASQWVLPVTGYELTARFGERSSLWATVHTGLDFAGPSGSTIVSVAAGVVKSTGYEGAYGNRTVITLTEGADKGTDIWYCHQSRIAVKPGQVVQPGEVIGYTGSTGNVTGPHLHLEVHPHGGDPVDPYPVLVAHGVQP